jgi:hypothetical protein
MIPAHHGGPRERHGLQQHQPADEDNQGGPADHKGGERREGGTAVVIPHDRQRFRQIRPQQHGTDREPGSQQHWEADREPQRLGVHSIEDLSHALTLPLRRPAGEDRLRPWPSEVSQVACQAAPK